MRFNLSSMPLKNSAFLAWQGVLDLLYPPACLLCGVSLEEGCLCVMCQQEFTPLPPPFCDRCGVPISAGVSLCSECTRGDFPPYDGSFALGHYAGTLRHAIHLLKYDQKPALAEPLGHLLAHYLQSEESLRNLSFDAVVPVPLHSSRRRERGFNQAERLARVIAKECGIPLNAHSLLRIRATRAQASLGGDSRRGNLDGAFALRHPNAFAGKSLLLVDDVLTTMSTVSACARILKNGGATQVIILGLARGG